MIQTAILGFGVVGSGTAEILTGKGETLLKKADELIDLKYILDIRDFPNSIFADLFVDDFSVIESDPEVSVVIEAIGGVGAALDFTERALRAGKSVVTSNKELVAVHGRRLMELAEKNGAVYLFEASVGGCIPILQPLSNCLAANEITEISGILNGTCNYILTRMIQDGVSFPRALEGAQANGYAEQDPTADIEGMDTCRKLCILSSIAFGWHLLPEQVPTRGISGLTPEDEAYAAACGCRVKLLGRVVRENGDTVCAYVEPHFVPLNNPLSGVSDVFNAILVKGSAVGDVMFYGQGAGKLPTASAVAADVIAAVRNPGRSAYRPWGKNRPEKIQSADSLASPWFVRLSEGELSGKKITVSGENPEESGWLTEPMTRRALTELTTGKKLLSAFRVLG